MEEMEYIKIPLHGKRGEGKYTLVDGDYDGEYFSQYKWYLMPNGYAARARIEAPAAERNSYVYLHQEICKPPKGMVVDHIDRDKLNNRSCNLRPATYRENALNRTVNLNPLTGNRHYKPRKMPIPKTGYRGVNIKKNRPKGYRAMFKSKYLGAYYTPEEAAKAYDKAAIAEYGDEAITNFPQK